MKPMSPRKLVFVYVAVGVIMFTIGVMISLFVGRIAHADNVSVYGPESGSITSTGQAFRPMEERTAAAYPNFAFGSVLQVCMPAGSPCTQVTVTDSTPTPWTWDVSWLAGQDLGLTDGIGRCECLVTPLYIP